MERIQFTDWDTVIINGNEMLADKFFKIMDNNIENDDYSVSYSEETREFRICFDGLWYKVVLSDTLKKDLENGALNECLRHLIALSRLQKMVDITESGSDLSISDTLDNDAKALYLQKLRNKKFSLSRYLNNYVNDISESWDDAKSTLGDNEIYDVLTFLGISSFGLLAGIITSAVVAYILDRLDTLDSEKGRAYQKKIGG